MTVAAGAGRAARSGSLAGALAFARGVAPSDVAELLAGEPVPFGDALAPLVVWARGVVAGRFAARPAALERFSAPARIALERALLRRLAGAAGPVLQARFERGLPRGTALTALFLGGARSSHEPSRERYRAFVDELRRDGLAEAFACHPVLAAFVEAILDAWCDATAELVERLDADLPLVRERFEWHADPGAVVAVEPDLSDPHHGGRSVAVLTFASGARLVYKPRSLAADAAFGDFLVWCDAGFRVPTVLDRHRYGWAEYIEHVPCADAAHVERFYRRAGMLLCVLYLCGTTDCHFENLVAHGEHPVLIDAETILQPQLAQPWSSAADADDRAWDTVVRTGLLPQWDFSADGRLALDTSALGSFAALQGSQPKPAWRDVNTDAMTRATQPWAPVAPRSVPLLAGEPVAPGAHLDAFVDGFYDMHRSVAARRSSLLAAAESLEPPLAALAAARVRFIPRATQDYMLVLSDALQPENLGDTADRDRAFGTLSRAFAASPDSRALAAIAPAERRALERLDVPHFTIAGTGADLDSGDGDEISIPVLAPGFADLVARLQRWDEADLRRQVAIVRGMFHARTARGFDVTSGAKPLPQPADPRMRRELAASFVAAARAIGDDLADASVPERDGSVSWLGLAHHAGADRFALEPLGFDLYGGTGGIALFFAALAAVTDEPRYRAHALAAADGLRRRLREPDAARALAARIGIGGATGAGSIVYALVRMASLLGEHALLDDARAAAAFVDDDAIARDDVFDPIAGAAGAIFGLIALHRAAPDASVLARAVAAGDHVLRHRTGAPGRRAWKNFADVPLTGMAHGAAGIALALVRLHAASGERRFLDGANEALAYERSVYAPDAGNWPDFRTLVARDGKPGYSAMWCHGAPGIGLARLAALRERDDPAAAAEVDAAVAATIAFGRCGPDYLCCGNLGRAELLLQAGVQLGRDDLRGRAEALAAELLDDARREGGFRLVYDMRASAFKPDLFRGAAGIGYELLRIAAPDRVPPVLTWD